MILSFTLFSALQHISCERFQLPVSICSSTDRYTAIRTKIVRISETADREPVATRGHLLFSFHCLEYSIHLVWWCIDSNYLKAVQFWFRQTTETFKIHGPLESYSSQQGSYLHFHVFFCLQCLAGPGCPCDMPVSTDSGAHISRTKQECLWVFFLFASISKMPTQSRGLAPARRQPAGEDRARFSLVGIKGLNQETEAGLNLDEKCCILPLLCQGSFIEHPKFSRSTCLAPLSSLTTFP